MKFIVIAAVILFSNNVFSNDVEKIRSEVEAQYEDKSSSLYQKLNSLMEVNHIPQESIFLLGASDMLYKGTQQNFNECTSTGCKAYERSFFQQFSDLRLKKVSGQVTAIDAWPLFIHMHIMRVWESNSNGDHLNLISEEVVLSNITFIY